jgi:hypothetical protein
MSDIPDEPESDPSFRRKMLSAYAQMLKERDDLVRQLNKELEDYETLKFDRPRVDGIIDKLQELDVILSSSRFSRVLHNATVIDRAYVGVRSLVTTRPKAAVEVIVAAVTAAVVAGGFHNFKGVFEEIFHRILGALTSKAYAAGTPAISPELDPIQLYIIIGFAVLIAIGFVWFAATATLSKEATTRRAAMDMAKNVMLFMMGLVTGYLSNRR